MEPERHFVEKAYRAEIAVVARLVIVRASINELTVEIDRRAITVAEAEDLDARRIDGERRSCQDRIPCRQVLRWRSLAPTRR